MTRGKLQVVLLAILAAAVIISSAIAAFLIHSDSRRFVEACLESRHQLNPSTADAVASVARIADDRTCLKDISVAVASTIGTAFGPLLVIMLSVIFMHKTATDDKLQNTQSRVALVIFALLQVLAVMILSWSVALTNNLLDLRPDALQNAIFTAVQGIIVAFVFPRGADTGNSSG